MRTLLSLSLLMSLKLFGQDPQIAWQKTIGADKTERLRHFSKTTDGAYLLAGDTDADISGNKTQDSYGLLDYWLVILNSEGDVVTDITYGAESFDDLTSAAQSSDGAYYLYGFSQSDMSPLKSEDKIGFRDYWIVKVNGVGDALWENTIGGTDDDWAKEMKPTSDGGCIIGGYSRSDASDDKSENAFAGSYDYWVVKLDADGEIEWENTIGSNGDDFLSSIAITSDGGYILGGTTGSDASGDKMEDAIGGNDYWVVKLDNTGAIEWEQTLGGTDSDQLNTLIETTDGGFIAGGESWSNIGGDKTENSVGPLSTDFWAIKLNSEGETEWDKTLGGTDFEQLFSITETSDGGFLFAGESTSNISGDKTGDSNGNQDYWLVKTTSTGVVQWDKTIGGSGTDRLVNLVETADNEFIMAGNSDSEISGDKSDAVIGEGGDFWLVKLNPITVGLEHEITESDITVFPNPTQAFIFIQTVENITVEIHAPTGELLFRERNQTTIDLTGFAPGTYVLTLLDENNQIVKKNQIIKV